MRSPARCRASVWPPLALLVGVVVVFNAPAYAWEDSPELVTHTSWNDSADTWGDEGLQANSRALTAAAAAAAAAATTPTAKLASCLAAIPGQPDVLLPSSPNFLVLANGLRTMRTRRPAAVVYPATVAQVQGALGCAAAAGVPPIPRSGGLSFENLSAGDGTLVIDLTSMAAVRVNVSAMTATVQLGARHGNMYHAITTAGRAVGRGNLTSLGGVWPQVGVGGVMAAGGYGSFSRKHGLFIDGVLRAKVVLANGTLVTASPKSNPDLFWAIRGGGGGTYGIVTQATVRLFEYPVVTIGALWTRDLADVPTFMDRFQKWAPGTTGDLTFTCNIWQNHIQLKVVYLGPKEELDGLMAASGLTGFAGARYASVECDVPGSRWWLVNNRFPPVCRMGADLSIEQRLEVGSRIYNRDRKAGKISSGYFRQLVPMSGWKQLQKLMTNDGGVSLEPRCFQFKAYGAFFDTVADDATPFPHRKGVVMHLEYGIGFGGNRTGRLPPPQARGSIRLPDGKWVVNDTRPPATQVPVLVPAASSDAATWAWYQKARAWVAKYAHQREAYNGYISYDDEVPDYFQKNYARLRAVKKRYDPLNVFHNVLSVPAS